MSYRSQQGVVLFFALIFLVAMTLAGVGLVRSVDTGNLVAGNLSFKKSALMSTDRGIQTAFVAIATQANTNRAMLANDGVITGYYSSLPSTGGSTQAFTTPSGMSCSISAGGSWSDQCWLYDNAWQNAVTMSADAAGNTVQYIIQRMCSQPNTAYNAGTNQDCQFVEDQSGKSHGAGTQSISGNKMVYYRITTRVKGPKNSISITQSTITVLG